MTQKRKRMCDDQKARKREPQGTQACVCTGCASIAWKRGATVQALHDHSWGGHGRFTNEYLNERIHAARTPGSRNPGVSLCREEIPNTIKNRHGLNPQIYNCLLRELGVAACPRREPFSQRMRYRLGPVDTRRHSKGGAAGCCKVRPRRAESESVRVRTVPGGDLSCISLSV